MINLRDEGKTVFFSTHILSDVESICDRVAILNKGKLISSGTLNELVSKDIQYIDLVWKSFNQSVIEYFEQDGGKTRQAENEMHIRISSKASESAAEFEARANEMIRKGQDLGAVLCAYSPKESSLEEIFVNQIGKLESRV
jgi:ABC-2 type transport system ATP-binding protein